jgi:hypothetical protein
MLVYLVKHSNFDLIHSISCFSQFVFDEFIAKGREIVHKVGRTLANWLVERSVCTQNEHEPNAPTRNWANRMVQFGKSDCPVPSAPMAVRGTVTSDEGILLRVNWRLTRKENKIHDNSRSCDKG